MKMRGWGGMPGRGDLQRSGGQSYRGYYGPGMMVPQQGQGMIVPRQGRGMMIVPQGQSGAQQYVPQGQVVPQSN